MSKLTSLSWTKLKELSTKERSPEEQKEYEKLLEKRREYYKKRYETTASNREKDSYKMIRIVDKSHPFYSTNKWFTVIKEQWGTEQKDCIYIFEGYLNDEKTTGSITINPTSNYILRRVNDRVLSENTIHREEKLEKIKYENSIFLNMIRAGKHKEKHIFVKVPNEDQSLLLRERARAHNYEKHLVTRLEGDTLYYRRYQTEFTLDINKDYYVLCFKTPRELAKQRISSRKYYKNNKESIRARYEENKTNPEFVSKRRESYYKNKRVDLSDDELDAILSIEDPKLIDIQIKIDKIKQMRKKVLQKDEEKL